jgi:hypothetical protein
MVYEAETSRNNPSCIFFLLDQSGSMADPFGGGEATLRKADGASDAINKLLSNLVIKCTKGEEVRDYYYLSVIGYGYGGGVAPRLGGALSGREIVSVSELANSPLRVEDRKRKVQDGAGGLVDEKVRFPVWFDPVADKGTPMCEALRLASKLLQPWVAEHSSCFPPIVINITDGEATDGDPSGPANEVRAIASSDGNVLLFNVHLSSQRAPPVVFPDSDALPDQFARSLFHISSTLPPHIIAAAKQEGIAVSDGSRGFVFNAGMVELINFLDIGTRPTSLR